MTDKEAVAKVNELAEKLYNNGHPIASIVLFVLAGAMTLGGGYLEEFGRIAGDVARSQLARSKDEGQSRLN